jgi:hypothetical protein
MSNAYRCDECGDFHEGDPALTTSLSVDANGNATGLLENIFSTSDGQVVIDLCSVECYQQIDFNEIRDDLLADVENKEQILNAEPRAVDVSEADSQ